MTLKDSGLHDLGFVGDPFTWRNNHHVAASFIKERLDRAAANSAWRCIFPLVRVANGDHRHSDHRPIIIDLGNKENSESNGPVQVLPKFEARWLEEEECETRVMEAWGRALEEMYDSMLEMQKNVLCDLWEWDRNVLGELERRIKRAKRELENCRQQGISQESVNREHLLHYKLECLQDQHHIYLKQRAHNTWLTKED